MRFTVAVLAVSLALFQACSASEATTGAPLEKRFLGLAGLLGAPSSFAMQGCGNQSGFLNVAALNQNTCGGNGGFTSAMSCGNAQGFLNVGALNTNNCQSMKSADTPQSNA